MKLGKIIAGVLLMLSIACTGAFVYFSSLSLSGEVANDLAMQQMTNDSLSSYGIHTYSQMVNFVDSFTIVVCLLWVVTILVSVGCFKKKEKKED